MSLQLVKDRSVLQADILDGAGQGLLGRETGHVVSQGGVIILGHIHIVDGNGLELFGRIVLHDQASVIQRIGRVHQELVGKSRIGQGIDFDKFHLFGKVAVSFDQLDDPAVGLVLFCSLVVKAVDRYVVFQRIQDLHSGRAGRVNVIAGQIDFEFELAEQDIE